MKINPGVVILGMPSSGKTVFLSILGHQFTLPAEGQTAAPLGFRLDANTPTRQAVNAHYCTLADRREWPKNTLEGQATPLQWNVLTGKRLVCQLSSMDISGETVRKAFGQDQSQDRVSSRPNNLGDGLLDESSDVRETTSKLDAAAEDLRTAVKAAKVVCLFVNIALQSAEQLKNFREAESSLCALLGDDSPVANKAIVVLTQTHNHRAEIEQAGGPLAYLGNKSRDLMQILSDKGIPVIMVSAVNETDEIGNKVPDVISSDGLFGFLLTVAGMIAEDELASVMAAYHSYLAARARYRLRPGRLIHERMPLVLDFKATGEAFHRTCLNYLSNPANLNESDKADCQLPKSAVDLYRLQTETDPEVASAAAEWIGPLQRDRIWDAVFREHVWAQDDVPADLSAFASEAKARLQKLQPNGTISTAFLFGFESGELPRNGETEGETGWVERNILAYKNLLHDEFASCSNTVRNLQDAIAGLQPASSDVLAAEMKLQQAQREIDDFRANWTATGTSGPHSQDLDKLVEGLKAAQANLLVCKRRGKRREAIRRARMSVMWGLMALSGILFVLKIRSVIGGKLEAARKKKLALIQEKFQKALDDGHTAFANGNYEEVDNCLSQARKLTRPEVDLKALAELEHALQSAREQIRLQKEERLNRLTHEFDTLIFQAEEHVRQINQTLDFQIDQVAHVLAAGELISQAQAVERDLKAISDSSQFADKIVSIQCALPRIVAIEGFLTGASGAKHVPVDISVSWGFFHFRKEPDILEAPHPRSKQRCVFIRNRERKSSKVWRLKLTHTSQTKEVIVEMDKAQPGINRRTVEFPPEP